MQSYSTTMRPRISYVHVATRDISQNQNGELVIHKQDGTIQNRDGHGNDPFPPKN